MLHQNLCCITICVVANLNEWILSILYEAFIHKKMRHNAHHSSFKSEIQIWPTNLLMFLDSSTNTKKPAQKKKEEEEKELVKKKLFRERRWSRKCLLRGGGVI